MSEGKAWSNWSGSLSFTPGIIEKPRDDDALSRIVQRAADEGRTVRVVGAGHSSSPLVKTDDVLVSLEKMQGVVSHDVEKGEAVVRTGMTVHDSGEALLDAGLAMHNTGDVDVQTLAGAIGTGTHGSGKNLQNLSMMLIGVKMVTSAGEVTTRSIEQEPELFRALRVSLGTLGIFTEMRLKLLPKFQLHRREWCALTDTAMAHLDELIEQNRNFDFYWYPRSDEVKLRTMNVPGEPDPDIPYAEVVKEETGWSADILPRKRVLKFDEMEYALPVEAGPECMQEIRQRVKAKHRKTVAWRVLYRTVAADDAYLSPAAGRETVTISLHHNAGMPYEEYFNDIEPIFRAHGGRPHWGKKHNLKAADLRKLYSDWERFAEARRKADPNGVFMNDYLKELLIED